MKISINAPGFLLCLILVCSSVFGGGHLVGNTTSFLRCTQDGHVLYEMYDIYEARFFEDSIPEQFDYGSGQNYVEKAKSIVKRLVPLNPTRYQLYLNFINSFSEKALVKTIFPKNNGPNDNTLSLIPNNCELVPVIINNMGYYAIDGSIWNQLTENQKAAVLVHEAIYNEALMIENSHHNSYFVRIFTRYLLGDRFKNMSLKDYHKFIQSIEFAEVDAHGFLIALNYYDGVSRKKKPVEYWNDQSVKKASLYLKGQSFVYGILLNYNLHWIPVMIDSDSYVTFYSNHQIETFRNAINPFLYNSYKLNKIDLSKIGFSGEMVFNFIHFSNTGEIVSVKYWGHFPEGIVLKLDHPAIDIAIKEPLSVINLEVTPHLSIQYTNISNENSCMVQLHNDASEWNGPEIGLGKKLVSLILKKHPSSQFTEKTVWCR